MGEGAKGEGNMEGTRRIDGNGGCVMNLLEETIGMLRKNGKAQEDVDWVGNNNIWFTWRDFAKVADTEYDDGFGGEEVSMDLLVVGKDFWLERHSYDGSEWWEFKRIPIYPRKYRVPVALTEGQAEEHGVRYPSSYRGLGNLNGWEVNDE